MEKQFESLTAADGKMEAVPENRDTEDTVVENLKDDNVGNDDETNDISPGYSLQGEETEFWPREVVRDTLQANVL